MICALLFSPAPHGPLLKTCERFASCPRSLPGRRRVLGEEVFSFLYLWTEEVLASLVQPIDRGAPVLLRRFSYPCHFAVRTGSSLECWPAGASVNRPELTTA